MDLFKTTRPEIEDRYIEKAIENFRQRLTHARNKHDAGGFLSTHEIFGVLKEEMNEFEEAIHRNEMNIIYSELLDIAQVAMFGIACIEKIWDETW